MEIIDARSIVSTLKNIVLNISISNIRGQCYDGCSTMTGARKGVAK